MTTTIYKYALNAPVVEFDIPVGGIVRHVATDDQVPTLWIEHPYPYPSSGEYADTERRTFVGYGTGHPIEGDLEFVGTATGVEGWMVIHIFERLS